jgi:hypothetical protein
VKVLDWGEDGAATAAEITALRASFRQEVAVWHKLDHPNATKVITHSFKSHLLKLMTDIQFCIDESGITLHIFECFVFIFATVCWSFNGNFKS